MRTHFCDPRPYLVAFRGAALLARNREVLLRDACGLASEESDIPNTPTTIFRIGSITKTFTVAAILRLVDAGAIDLGANIGMSLEELPETWNLLLSTSC